MHKTPANNQSRPPAAERPAGSTPARTVYDRAYVESLFDSIAPRYDLLNRILSAGIDVRWRRRAIRFLVPSAPKRLLDIATGTADVALTAARMLDAQIVAVDVAGEMLEHARRKVQRSGLAGRITLERAAAEELPFPSASFDAVTVAFGVRNFADLHRGLAEMARVLRPGGTAVILEFSKPHGSLLGLMYRFYAQQVLPRVAGAVSRNREAYEYLPRTVAQFPDGAEFAVLLRSAGFSHVTWERQTGGISTVYRAVK